VGEGKQYTSPNEVSSIAQDNDTILIEQGTYHDQATAWDADNLVIMGRTKYAHLVAPAVIPNQKAIWVIRGRNTKVENIEFSEASVPDQNGAGIRQEGVNLEVRNCFFHDCEDGILGGGGGTSNVTILYTEFSNCGFGDGYSHNMYITSISKFIIAFCYSHNAKIGHLIKSRADTNYILYNRLTDEDGSTASYEINIPNGGQTYVIGNIIEQAESSENSTIVDFGSEGYANPDRSLYCINNTIVNKRSQGTFFRLANGAENSKIVNNLLIGSGTVVVGEAEEINNIFVSESDLVDFNSYNYQLDSGSEAIEKGTISELENDTNLVPKYEYIHPCEKRERSIIGTIDIGAYEYISKTGTKNNLIKKGSFIKLKNRNIGLSKNIFNILGQSIEIPDNYSFTKNARAKSSNVFFSENRIRFYIVK
jgi:hypothetical protein